MSSPTPPAGETQDTGAPAALPPEARKHAILRCTAIGAVVNGLLSFAKLVCALLGHSAAMVADAVHSFSDLASDLVVVLLVRVASRPPDREHDYGHGKFETLATILISLALFFVGLGILYSGAVRAHALYHGADLPAPNGWALGAALLSIVCKELLYRWTRLRGEALKAPAVIANAWHHRSDALSSIGALLGIAGAMFLGPHFRFLDPLAAIAVAFLILLAAYKLFVPAIGELLEVSLPEDVEEEILRITTSVPGVLTPHNLRTRRIGSAYAIELHFRVNPDLNICDAHALTKDVERALRARYGAWTHIILHAEPDLPPSQKP